MTKTVAIGYSLGFKTYIELLLLFMHWFKNYDIYQIHLEGLLKLRFLDVTFSVYQRYIWSDSYNLHF